MKKITRIYLALATLFAFGTVAASAQPSVAAPTPPTRSTAKVISIFSDAYTDVTGTNFNPGWGQATIVTTEQIAGNATLKYAGLNYQGTALSGSINALTMNKLHIDVWSSDATSFQITPISPGPKEKLISLSPLTLNSWNSYDIDLSEFTGVSMSDIFQFKIVGNGTVYIDNLYLYDNTTTVDTEAPTAFTATKGNVTSDAVEIKLNAIDNSGAINYTITYGTTVLTVGGISGVEKTYTVGGLLGGTSYSFTVEAKDATGNAASNSPIILAATTLPSLPAAPTPTRPAAAVISIYSDAYTNVANTNFFPGWGQNTVASIVPLGDNNPTLKYTNLNYQGVELGSHVDASAMTTLHVDVYTESETALQVTPISPSKEFLVTLSPLTLNAWNSFDVPLSSFTGVVMSDVFQFKFVGNPNGKTVYIDNLYFYNGTSSATPTVQSSSAVKVYPTKVTDKLIIKSETTVKQVIVRNLLGQSVKTFILNSNDQTLDLSAFVAGNYLVTLELANGQSFIQKIVKL